MLAKSDGEKTPPSEISFHTRISKSRIIPNFPKYFSSRTCLEPIATREQAVNRRSATRFSTVSATTDWWSFPPPKATPWNSGRHFKGHQGNLGRYTYSSPTTRSKICTLDTKRPNCQQGRKRRIGKRPPYTWTLARFVSIPVNDPPLTRLPLPPRWTIEFIAQSTSREILLRRKEHDPANYSFRFLLDFSFRFVRTPSPSRGNKIDSRT